MLGNLPRLCGYAVATTFFYVLLRVAHAAFRRRVVAAGLSACCLVLAFFLAGASLGPYWYALSLSTSLASPYLLWLGLTWRRFYQPVRSEPARTVLAFVLGATIVAVVALVLGALLRADETTKGTLQGARLGVAPAVPARPRWSANSAPALPCSYYLGSANGSAVFYLPSRGRAEFLPAEALRWRTYPSLKACRTAEGIRN